LKYCFIIQVERVESMLKMEEKMNLLLPHGHKEIGVLIKIAAEVRKYEVGKLSMKGQKTTPVGNPCSNGAPPYVRTNQSPWTSDFGALDEIDKDALHAAAGRVIERIEKDAVDTEGDGRVEN
jgi:hypothetical protein